VVVPWWCVTAFLMICSETFNGFIQDIAKGNTKCTKPDHPPHSIKLCQILPPQLVPITLSPNDNCFTNLLGEEEDDPEDEVVGESMGDRDGEFEGDDEEEDDLLLLLLFE
jgi:hypothetical protein